MIIDNLFNPKRTVVEGSAANDYFTRRKSEEDRIAGVKAPAKNKKNPANTDYAKKRKQQDVEESFGRRPDHGREERHDLDPTDWYIVKDGKMFAASIYPRQVKQAEAEGFCRTKQEARARASSQGVAEGLTEMDKSQPSAGRDTGPRSGPEKIAKPISKEKMVNHALDTLSKSMAKKDDKKKDVKESDTLMIKLKRAMIKEGRVKELADDLKTLNDTEFMKKYGKAKAALRKDMKKVDEGNANSGRRNPIARPDNVPVKLGRIKKLKTGIEHHADSSRYGGTVPDTDDDHLLSPAARHRLHKAVTPDHDIDEARTSAAQRLSTAWDKQRAKSNASLARTPSSIPKKQEPKKVDTVPKSVSEHRVKRRALMAQMLNSH